jgi:hypothetical protein
VLEINLDLPKQGYIYIYIYCSYGSNQYEALLHNSQLPEHLREADKWQSCGGYHLVCKHWQVGARFCCVATIHLSSDAVVLRRYGSVASASRSESPGL